MGLKSNPKADSDSETASPSTEELISQLRSSFFSNEFQSVAKTLMEREHKMKEKFFKLKTNAEEEKRHLVSENLKYKNELKKNKQFEIDAMKKINDELKKKQTEIEAMKKVNDEYERKVRVLEKRCLDLDDKVLGLEKMALASACSSVNLEKKDCAAESCRPPLFSEKEDSKKKAEPKFLEIIDIDDDDDDKVDKGKWVPEEIKREYNMDDEDDLKYVSTIKRKRVSNELVRELNTKREHHGESAKNSPFYKKTELDSSGSDSDTDSYKVNKMYKSSLAKMKKQNERWEAESDMVKDFEKDDELCLNGVCALHRQKIIVHGTDIYSMCKLAWKLIDGDSQKKLKKKASELDKIDLDQCRMFAKKYALQLFNIYQEKTDPFFPPSRSQEKRSTLSETIIEGMDELMDNEATAVDVIDGKQFLAKDNGFLTKHGRLNMQEMLMIPGDVNIQESTTCLYIDGKNVARVDTSEHACANTRCLDDAGAIVEELTVRNYSSGNLEIHASSIKERKQSTHNIWHAFFPHKMHNSNRQQTEIQSNTIQCEDKQPGSCNTLVSPTVIRTKMLSQSGFSKYFVKNTLKGKGVICSGTSPDRDHNRPKSTLMDGNSTHDSSKETTANPYSVYEELSLREWLKSGQNKVDKSKSMYIFKQILDLVDSSHSRGEVLLALRPSCFKLMPLNRVLYMGSPNFSSKESGNSENYGDKKRESEHTLVAGASQNSKRRKHGEGGNSFCRWPQFASNSGFKDSGYGFNEESIFQGENTYTSRGMSATPQKVSNFGSDALEEQWYASPEDSNERCSTFSSNVYSLGVLLFELLGSFESASAHATAMMDLQKRILPPSYLSENSKEAGFCLWLLHPEPSLRPTPRDILQSEFIRGIQRSSMKIVSHEDTESDLMLHFLVSLNEQRQKDATKLVEDIKYLESDISEIESRHPSYTSTSHESGSNFSDQENHPLFGGKLKSSAISSVGGSQLIKNISHLEQAYFSVRSTIRNPDPDDIKESGEHEVLRSRENIFETKKMEANKKPPDRLGVFFNGLCKYARYTKFEVRGTLKNGDFSSMGNVICSLGFDRDEDYFATAGVSKKIKVYDFHALLDDSVDIHYPAVEMSNKSKLSSICWNSYIRNYIASTDYDGVIKIWDAGTGEEISHHIEHERRAWSVDFSRVDPRKLASGSDDCSVKLWSMNEKKSLATIKTAANVCCVQFSPYSTHLLSFGAADYRTYCYDLRNVSTPMCALSGHERAVSYVKFLDCETIVSASTDNTLKLWDLNKADFGCLSTSSCILTFKGHTNEKNFVGLSVADGYIACGSETNEVFAYYRSLPMPITSHKFGSIDPISGKETENESNHFVSSVCWRQKSDMVIAANSNGCLKLLQLI
ncbi:hypothetical protein QVD17_04302 [Tagetes erecta]|uniref:Uncharacterized protein n=1 Tax=Tagetes erecta TaxID=13708 RepID=A0AAD8LCI1_TARER|nr:hypothetical protein QVD17_04302 [Tagetes erecta]